VDVAQLVEPRIVIPAVVGSSPIVHPIFTMASNQMALASSAGTPHDGSWAVSSIGRAADS
jgi:hypothetical protein